MSGRGPEFSPVPASPLAGSTQPGCAVCGWCPCLAERLQTRTAPLWCVPRSPLQDTARCGDFTQGGGSIVSVAPSRGTCRVRARVMPEPRAGAAAGGATRGLGPPRRGPLTNAPRCFIWRLKSQGQNLGHHPCGPRESLGPGSSWPRSLLPPDPVI